MKISIVPLVVLVLAASVIPRPLSAADEQGSSRKSSRSKNSADEAQPATAKYVLKYHFQPGEIVRSRVTHLATMETSIAGSSQTSEMSTVSVRVWKILDVDAAGQITFEHSVESVDMRNQMSGHDAVRFNSVTDKKAPFGYEDVAKSLGRPLAVCTISPAGKILKREDKYRQPAADASGSQLVVPLPAEAVAVGNVWTTPHEVSVKDENGQSKKIQIRDRYELEKVHDAVATIGVETQALTPLSSPEIQAQLIQRLTKGTIRFDIDAGRIIGQHTDLDEQVHGFHGPDSSMHYVAKSTEEVLTPEPKTAARTMP